MEISFKVSQKDFRGSRQSRRVSYVGVASPGPVYMIHIEYRPLIYEENFINTKYDIVAPIWENTHPFSFLIDIASLSKNDSRHGVAVNNNSINIAMGLGKGHLCQFR